jgi:deoxycytidylate deaminase
MYAAKGAALRSLDLSRQVGAAIFTSNGEILSLGSNEVPKAGGGTYWPDNDNDDRDFKRGCDCNEDKKRIVLMEVAAALGVESKIEDLLANPKIKNSQLMDVLEYGRTVHAEMSAICDAARLGISIKNAYTVRLSLATSAQNILSMLA